MLSSLQAAKIFDIPGLKNCDQMAPVATEKGDISRELFDFALLVDGPDAREDAWVMNCCACFAFSDITTKTDLIGLMADDLRVTEEQTGLAVTGGQRAWLRRCIEKASRDFVGAIATRGEEAPPQQGEVNKEVCDSFQVPH